MQMPFIISNNAKSAIILSSPNGYGHIITNIIHYYNADHIDSEKSQL